MSITASWGGKGGGFGVLVHGGAGRIPDDRAGVHEAGCRAAATVALDILRNGGVALDAVQKAVEALETDPAFNAGVGASLTTEGGVEHDASIMEGKRLRAGAVCVLRGFERPIAIARAVLEDGRHVMYGGTGAERFALEAGFSPVDPKTLITDAARERLRRALEKRRAETWAGNTVGAVAIDRSGSVAAATSTGGPMAKQPGRIGDSPLIGAGTYADDDAGAASATGDGEEILRLALSSSCVAAMRGGLDPERAAREGVDTLNARVGGTGGIILVDESGALGWARSTPTMSWAGGSERSELESGI